MCSTMVELSLSLSPPPLPSPPHGLLVPLIIILPRSLSLCSWQGLRDSVPVQPLSVRWKLQKSDRTESVVTVDSSLPLIPLAKQEC